MTVQCPYNRKEGDSIRDKKMTIRVSEKMMNEFDEALGINEETKSEIVRACIRNYIKKSKEENK